MITTSRALKLEKPVKKYTPSLAPLHYDSPLMHGTVRTYTIGFGLSLLLTFEAFYIATHQSLGATNASIIVLVLAIVQLLVQLFFFLHLDRAAKAPWNVLIFIFTAVIVSIVVFGSLWIMNNLNYHMGQRMTPQQADSYIKHDEGISR